MTNALLRLAFARAPVFTTLTKPLPISRRLILQQERSQTLNRSPTACKLMVSCSISLPSRGSFHLSLTVLFHYRSFSNIQPYEVVLADSHGISRAPCYLGFNLIVSIFEYETITLYGQVFQTCSSNCHSIVYNCPTTLNYELSLGCSRFARRYSGNRFYFLFLQVLRCFNSLGSLLLIYEFNKQLLLKFPHSETSGSQLVSSSPKRIVGNHVLHRF